MTTIHASAVLVGRKAVLIRGASGSGKSRLAFELIEAGRNGTLPFTRLVSDDRTHIEARHGQLLARPAQELAGLIEIRGLGIRRLPFEPMAAVGLLVDLGAAGARMPAQEEAGTTLEGIALPRLAVASHDQALPGILAMLHSIPASD